MTLAFICGCAGPSLTEEERAFIQETQPWGLILFKRNVVDRPQMRALADSFRALVGRADAPVLIDQEGGRVQRMAPPHWQAYPSAATLGALADHESALEAARLCARLIAYDLAEVGVNVDCTPVLDVAQTGMHAVIGTRSWSSDPARVVDFGRAVAQALIAGGVAPVIKHIPGHGRASVDSHLELPVVSAARADLAASDFAPFKALRDLPMAMTAHVVFTAIDPARPATTSKIVVDEIIRGAIGFDGLLISDDLSMKALGGPFADRAAAVFAAGVDIALHCNGDLTETREVVRVTPELEGRALQRARAALATIAGGAEPFDVEGARARLAEALAASGA
jgi:beta-N-acetylhexosaminidase